MYTGAEIFHNQVLDSYHRTNLVRYQTNKNAALKTNLHNEIVSKLNDFAFWQLFFAPEGAGQFLFSWMKKKVLETVYTVKFHKNGKNAAIKTRKTLVFLNTFPLSYVFTTFLTGSNCNASNSVQYSKTSSNAENYEKSISLWKDETGVYSFYLMEKPAIFSQSTERCE